MERPRQNLTLALLMTAALVLATLLSLLYVLRSSQPAASQTPVQFDAFTTLDPQGLASLQVKFSWLGYQAEPVYTVAFSTEGHPLDIDEFTPYRNSAFSYPNDNDDLLFTFTATTGEMTAVVDGIGQVPGATDGVVGDPPRVSIMLQAVPTSGDIGFEDILDACDTWRVLRWTDNQLGLGNVEGHDVIAEASGLYTGADGDGDGVNDDCDPCADTPDCDGDDFTDYAELIMGTDPEDDCTNDPGVHDAWPLDNNIDTWVTVGGDVLPYRGRIGATGGPPSDPNWWQRLDINADNYITVGGDVLPFRGMVGAQCPLP